MSALSDEPLAYWEALNPKANITETPWQTPTEFEPWPVDVAQNMRVELGEEGYAVSPVSFDKAQVTPLIEIVLNVVRAGHRPAYALVYDEFYAFFSRIGQFLEQIFHARVLCVPDEFDVHYVPVSDRATGSKPHRDSIGAVNYLDSQGLPKLLNIWVPLTDATLQNSCIYVLPANHDPEYQNAVSGGLVHWQLDDPTIQSTRAVPADAGAILLWAPSLLHWGSRSSAKAAAPRISLACYFQSADAEKFHPTAIPMTGSLPFHARVALIDKVCKKNSKHEKSL
ncbi:MAG: phytanoyl-CoA dioxygenase family protein [Pseudomonadota bacterium]